MASQTVTRVPEGDCAAPSFRHILTTVRLNSLARLFGDGRDLQRSFAADEWIALR
jgi:hypothetical protein